MLYQARDRQEPAWRVEDSTVGTDEVEAALKNMGHLSQVRNPCRSRPLPWVCAFAARAGLARGADDPRGHVFLHGER